MGLLWAKAKVRWPHFLSISLELPGLGEARWVRRHSPESSLCVRTGLKTGLSSGGGLASTEAMSTPALTFGWRGDLTSSRSVTTALSEEGMRGGGPWARLALHGGGLVCQGLATSQPGLRLPVLPDGQLST